MALSSKKIICPHCGQKFKKMSSLKTHIQSIHEGKTYQCQYCEQKYTLKSTLNKHIKSIHEGKTYQCQHCEQKYTQNNTLKIVGTLLCFTFMYRLDVFIEITF